LSNLSETRRGGATKNDRIIAFRNNFPLLFSVGTPKSRNNAVQIVVPTDNIANDSRVFDFPGNVHNRRSGMYVIGDVESEFPESFDGILSVKRFHESSRSTTIHC
jgi:hypothetical protein